MQSDDGEKKADTGEYRHVADHSSLLETLKNLHRRVSARLWHKRLSAASGPISAGEESAAIRSSLTPHLEEHAVDFEKFTSSGGSNEDAGPSAATPRSSKVTSPPKLGFFKSLASHFGRRHAVTGVQPHLAVQMQAKTKEHINRALQLARRGNAEGAKVYVDLAEQAMKTASQYMEKQDYATFKDEVESRLKEILSK